MAGETYDDLIPPSGSTFIAGHAARASQIEQVRQNLTILGKRRYWDLGGSEIDGHDEPTYARLRSGKVVELCEEDLRGLTVTLQVWVHVDDAGSTVRVRLRNVDIGANVAEMVAAVSDVLPTLYEVACTLPTGTTPRSCRLEILTTGAGSPTSYGYAYGQLEIAL